MATANGGKQGRLQAVDVPQPESSMSLMQRAQRASTERESARLEVVRLDGAIDAGRNAVRAALKNYVKDPSAALKGEVEARRSETKALMDRLDHQRELVLASATAEQELLAEHAAAEAREAKDRRDRHARFLEEDLEAVRTRVLEGIVHLVAHSSTVAGMPVADFDQCLRFHLGERLGPVELNRSAMSLFAEIDRKGVGHG